MIAIIGLAFLVAVFIYAVIFFLKLLKGVFTILGVLLRIGIIIAAALIAVALLGI